MKIGGSNEKGSFSFPNDFNPDRVALTPVRYSSK